MTLKKLNEDDVQELVESTSVRLDSGNTSKWFWSTIIAEVCFLAPATFVLKHSSQITPEHIITNIVEVGWMWVIIHFILAVIFSFKKIAYGYQHWQFIVLCVVALIFSNIVYVPIFSFLADREISGLSLYASLLIVAGGWIYLLIVSIIQLRMLRSGHYRDGGYLHMKHLKYLIFIPLGYGLLMLAIAVWFDPSMMAEMILPFLFCFIVSYAISLAWPEFLLLTIIKWKFESARLDEKGMPFNSSS